MRLFNKHYVLVVLTTLATTSAVGQVNAQIVTADLKNLKALTEGAVTTLSMIIQNFGFSKDEKLEFEGSFTESEWSLKIEGTYLTLPVELSFTGSLDGRSNRGTIDSSGKIGPSDWTGFGSYRFSDIGSKGFSMIFESEARINNRVLDIHVRKHWTFQRKGKHVVSEDIGTVQLTENGRPIGRPVRERSFDIFGVASPRTGTVEVTIADGSFLKGTFNLDSEVIGSVLTVLALAQGQEEPEAMESEVEGERHGVKRKVKVRFIKDKGAKDEDVRKVKERFDKFIAVANSVLKEEVLISAGERSTNELEIKVVRNSEKILFGSASPEFGSATIDVGDFDVIENFTDDSEADIGLLIKFYLETALVHEIRHTGQGQLPDLRDQDAVDVENKAWKQLTDGKVERQGGPDTNGLQVYKIQGRSVSVSFNDMKEEGLGPPPHGRPPKE
jgi:hypothetical protein